MSAPAAPAPPDADAPSPLLRARADAAGLDVDWVDHEGRARTVSADTLEALLQQLERGSADDWAAAAGPGAGHRSGVLPALVTARVGEPVRVALPAGLRPAVVSALRAHGDAWPVAGVGAQGEPACIELAACGEPGYHPVRLTLDGITHGLQVAVAPRRAFGVDAGERMWGTAVQLHALRPAAALKLLDSGIGDHGALAVLARSAAAAGADALMVSPTHAGFAAEPARCSPYSPSHRLGYNVLLIDPVAVAGPQAAQDAAGAAGIAGELQALQAAALIDWPLAGRLKLRWLRALFDAHGRHAPVAPQGPDAAALHRHAVFEALHAHFTALRAGTPPAPPGPEGWHAWPASYQHPDGPAVAAFAREHADEVAFHAWLQAQAEAGVQRAQQAARAAGMRVGLIADLAVGVVPGGSQVWSEPDEWVAGVEIGAPPDPLGPAGQRWGLTTFAPRALVRNGYRPFIAMLRAAMRHAGAIRIDHVLGLQRLWVVPAGAPATAGAYLRYPVRDLVNLVVLEAHRHRALVIGEDLGTVPAGLRTLLAEAGILGMQVLWFEREGDGRFRPPSQWSDHSVAMTTTHDLPTVAGWWEGRDIAWQATVGTVSDVPAAQRRRDADRQALATAMGAGAPATAAAGVDVAIDLVAATPAPLAIVPLEDLLGLHEQPNLPGTVAQHPNWRRRLPLAADRLLDCAPARLRTARLRALRPRRR